MKAVTEDIKYRILRQKLNLLPSTVPQDQLSTIDLTSLIESIQDPLVLRLKTKLDITFANMVQVNEIREVSEKLKDLDEGVLLHHLKRNDILISIILIIIFLVGTIILLKKAETPSTEEERAQGNYEYAGNAFLNILCHTVN